MKARQEFFFEKKNPKTFVYGRASVERSATARAKVFWFFFSKKNCFLALALSSCSSPDPVYYTLQVVPGTPLPGSAATVEVRRPGLAGYLDRADVILKSAAYRLDVNSQLRWAEPLGDMIGRVLAQDIGQRLPAATVFTQSGAITADPSFRVEVDILAFDADAAGQVTLAAQLAIERGTTHRPLASRHVALTATPAAPGAAALAATMSTLLGQLADQTAAALAAPSS